MQCRKTFGALTSLLPSAAILLKLARQSLFVLRTPRKIFPNQLLRGVLLAVCENTPHFRAVAEKISSICDHDPSRQAVFERLKNEAAPGFFSCAFRQVLVEQCRRFTDRHLAATLDHYTGIFRRIIIEDGSVLPLHRSLADRFRGSVNQYGESAALRLRWAFDFLTGETIDAQLHHWRENDMSTAFELLAFVKKGDLLLRDMGYFCLQSFHEIIAASAYFITRLPEGTVVSDEDGKRMNLLRSIRKGDRNLYEARVKVGLENPVEGRLVAARIDAAKAVQRKSRLRQSCKEQGKVATRNELAMCEWVVVFTNLEASVMDAESVAQLYRARWMVEVFFKAMKSGQQLEKWSRHRTNENTIQCLAYAQMIVAILSLNLWRVMGRMLVERGQENSNGNTRGRERDESSSLPTVGPIKALESLVALLVKVFEGKLRGRKLSNELARLARYAAQEKRTRPSLDAFVISLLT
jgi:IS4 transposase